MLEQRQAIRHPAPFLSARPSEQSCAEVSTGLLPRVSGCAETSAGLARWSLLISPSAGRAGSGGCFLGDAARQLWRVYRITVYTRAAGCVSEGRSRRHGHLDLSGWAGLLVNIVLNGLCIMCILRPAIFCSCSVVSCRGSVERLVVSARCCPWKTRVGCSYSPAVPLKAAVVEGVRSNYTEPVAATKL